MKNTSIVCMIIGLFMTVYVSNVDARGKNLRSSKSTTSIDDSTFVIPEVDLKLLNITPRFTNEVYSRRLDSLTKLIPLDYNSHVQGYIDLYAYRKREQIERMLGLSEFYFPMVEKVFKEYNIPAEFKYLAIVESALNPYAVSPVGATGMWQFMFTTGKMYNLKITSHIDERRDPYLATHAAAKYFVDMYKKYGDWLLVIAAYNCGPGNVNKAVRKAGGVKNFWAIRQYLPNETRGYVPAYIAATYIMNFAEEHNIYPSYPSFSFMTDTVYFNKPVSFKDIEVLCGVSGSELRILNPSFKKDFIPAYSQSYMIKVPATRKDLVALNRDSLYSLFPQQVLESDFVLNTDPMAKSKTIYKTHVVKRGESISRVSAKYGVSVADIKKWNNLSRSNLMAGQKLKIKKQIGTPTVSEATVASRKKIEPIATPNPQDANGTKTTYEYVTRNVTKTHTVKRGENLSLIAAKYDVKLDDIKSWNKLKSSKLAVGQAIRVKTTETKKIAKKVTAPKEVTEPASAEMIAQNKTEAPVQESKKVNDEVEIVTVEKNINYSVKAGDHLSGIADKYEVTVQDLKTWNNLKSSSIQSGQKLSIKKSEQKVIVKNTSTPSTEDSKKVPSRLEAMKFAFHKVERGDTLWSIARQYEGMTVEKLRELNGLKNEDPIKTGMILKVN